MIRIKEIELREIRMPLKEPFRISSGQIEERHILLVRLLDVDGVVGWGECVAGEKPNYSPETIATSWTVIREWGAWRLLGQGIGRPEEIRGLLDRDFRGHNMSKAALEMAAWELEARRRGLSLSRLLGGTRQRIATGISLGIQPTPAHLVEKARQALRMGYRKIKLKIEPGNDIEYVRAVRQALPDAPLMVDANNAYQLEDLSRLKVLDELGLIMIEQPLAWDDLVRHARLQRELRTPVCLDESITSPERAEDMLELGSGKIVNIKPGRVGGFSASRAIHDLCLRHSVPVWCGGMLESGIGRAHNVALASLPNFTIPGDLSPSSRYWSRDIVTPEWTMDGEGMIEVPRDRPGMGVEVDRDKLEERTVRCESLRSS